MTILPVDINQSDWDSRLVAVADAPTTGPASRHALRLGLRLVKGLARGEGERIAASRQPPFATIDEVMQRVDVSARAIQAIATADGRVSLGLTRRQALWQAQRLAASGIMNCRYLPLPGHKRSWRGRYKYWLGAAGDLANGQPSA